MFEPTEKCKRYEGCFGRPYKKKKNKTKLVLPLQREHRFARRKKSDCNMYEGVREVMSKHGAETSCFTSERKVVLLFAMSAQNKR